MLFIILAIILVLFITAFILFLLFLRKMNEEQFMKFCKRKVSRIAKRRKLNSIEDLHLLNYSREKLAVNHVIFGKKFIYLISDYLLKGFVSGNANDNSWVYYNNIKKKNEYLPNLNQISGKNIKEFSEILGISTDFVVSISLIPNECDFKIEALKEDKQFITHYSSLNRKIKQLEKREVGTLNEEQVYEQFRTIKSKNEERN